MSDDSRAIVPVGQRGVITSVGRQIAITEKVLGQIHAFGALSTTCTKNIELVAQFAKSIAIAVISDDGKFILTVPEDENVIYLWDVATESLLRVFGHNIPDSFTLKFQENNTSVVTEHSDYSTRYWDLPSGTCYCQPTLSGLVFKRAINQTFFSIDSESIDSPDCRYSLFKIPINTDEEDASDSDHENTYLLVSSDSTTEQQTSLGSKDDYPIALSNGGHYALLGDMSSKPLSFSLWDVDAESVIGNFGINAHIIKYHHVACSDDECHIVATGSGSYLHHWDLQKGKLISCVQCADRVDAIGFSKENHLLISQRVFQQSLFSWQVMHPKSAWPDFNGDIRFQLCDVHTGRCLKTYETERDFFKAMVISTNAKDSNVLPIFSAGVLFKSSRTCRFWLKGTRSTKDVIHPDVVTSMNFSPDEKCFATGCADHVVRIWNIDGALSKVFDGHVAAITAAKFSPSGDQLVSASEDRTIRLWNIETNDCIRIFTGHNNSVIYASFTNDGQQIISVSEDGTIRFWGVKTGAEIVRCYGFDDGNWVIVTPDGRYDSSNGGECPHLRWTVGMESYPVEKFKGRYYTPGLLVKARGE